MFRISSIEHQRAACLDASTKNAPTTCLAGSAGTMTASTISDIAQKKEDASQVPPNFELDVERDLEAVHVLLVEKVSKNSLFFSGGGLKDLRKKN